MRAIVAKFLNWKWYIGAITILSIVGISIFSSESFKECKEKYDHEKSTNSIYYKPPIFSPYVDCVGDFVDHHTEAIIAIGTVFIACFTLTLVWVTHLLRVSGERQIATTRACERAYLNISHWSPPASDPGRAMSFSGNLAFVSFEIKNHGRTPADVLGGRMRLHRLPAGQNLPVNPDYTGPESIAFGGFHFLVTGDKFFN